MIKKCQQCGKAIWVTPSGSKRKYCSMKCMGESKKGIYFYDRRGKLHSPETKAKLKKSRVGGKPALGMKHTEEAKKKIRESMIKKRGYGGKFRTTEGYVKINCNDREHPYKDNQGYVLEHRLVVEKVLGRFLLPHELVHHLNEDVADNRRENLYITSPSEHNKLHWAKRKGKPLKLISNLDNYEEIS